MTEEQATAVADALGGETWQSGGDIWLVLLQRADGKVTAISEDIVCEYENEESLHMGTASLSIPLR
jgi:hypothetical protein